MYNYRIVRVNNSSVKCKKKKKKLKIHEAPEQLEPVADSRYGDQGDCLGCNFLGDVIISRDFLFFLNNICSNFSRSIFFLRLLLLLRYIVCTLSYEPWTRFKFNFGYRQKLNIDLSRLTERVRFRPREFVVDSLGYKYLILVVFSFNLPSSNPPRRGTVQL